MILGVRGLGAEHGPRILQVRALLRVKVCGCSESPVHGGGGRRWLRSAGVVLVARLKSAAAYRRRLYLQGYRARPYLQGKCLGLFKVRGV
eukprot:3028992-Lingulodinium_polyedra.AAC.1